VGYVSSVARDQHHPASSRAIAAVATLCAACRGRRTGPTGGAGAGGPHLPAVGQRPGPCPIEPVPV